MTTIREEIRNNYPEILSLENIRCILRISKRKASWMLQNGIIKCENNGKKTRQYKVTLDDLFEYLDRLEQSNPSVAPALQQRCQPNHRLHKNDGQPMDGKENPANRANPMRSHHNKDLAR